MPTIIHRLDEDPEELEMFSGFVPGYVEGECYAFAIALHRAFGWPLVGLMDGDVIRHAAARTENGSLHDARGLISLEEFGKPFLDPPFVLRDITESDLYATRPINDRSIQLARRIAETLWPDLPWKDSLAMRVAAFADELEALSRKHGLWILGNVPANPPVLMPDDGTYQGYELGLTVGAGAYTINRHVIKAG